MQNNFNAPTSIAIAAVSIILLATVIIAVWKSAQANQKMWFVPIIVTLLIYPILALIISIAYLFFFSKKKLTFTEIKSWFGINQKK
jgi:hypothetical protein